MAEESSTAVEQNRRYGQMIARAWIEPSFKKRLLAEPAAVAREQGLEIPEGLPLRAIEVAPDETYVVLWSEQVPDAGDMDEEERPWRSLLERTVSDPAYKARLIAEPVAALAEQGIDLPADARVVVMEPSDTEGYLFVPQVPEGLEIETLADDDTTGFYTCAASHGKCDANIVFRSVSSRSQPYWVVGSPYAFQVWRL